MSHFTHTRRSFVPRTWRTALLALACLLALCGTATAGDGAGHDVSNPANPWDHVGSWHNEMLDYVVGARSVVGDSRATLATAVVGRGYEFAAAKTGSPCSYDVVDMDLIAGLVAHSDEANTLVSKALNAEQVQYFLRIDAIASRFGETPDAALDEMRAIEQEIIDSMSADDAAPLLIGTSVGRFSYAYWTAQASMGDKSPWLVGSGLGGGSDRFLIPNWLKADLKGAIVGAAGGVGGGPGGILLGGLLGGGVASAIEVIDGLP